MKRIFIALFLTVIGIQSFAQQNIPPSAFYGKITGYNFFVGKNAADFKTVPKALGSGIFDFSGVSGQGIWILNPEKSFMGLSLGLTYKITKFRFEKPWYFNSCPLTYDTDPTHTYNPFFFSRQGSKLVFISADIPVLALFPVASWFGGKVTDFSIFAGASYERYISSYQKIRYSIGDEKEYIKYGNETLKKMPFQKNNIIFSAGIVLKRVLIRADYQFFSLFTQTYDLHYVNVGISYLLTSDLLGGKNKEENEIKNILPTFETKF